MNKMINAGLALGIMTSAIGCSGERASFESQEQVTDVARPNLDNITTTTVARVAITETTRATTTVATTEITSPTSTTIEFSPTSEGCNEGENYAPLAIARIDLNVETICSGNGKFILPSIAPGSPTIEKFSNSATSSLAVIGHRTAHGGPFSQLDELVTGDTIEFGDKSYTVSSTGMIDDSKALSWLNENIASSPSQVLGLLTCSDSLGDARGENAGQKGTENRLFVIAIPTESQSN